MDLTTPVTMDQVVKERERKERVGRGRNGQTTSLDEIEPLEPQRAQHTTRAASPHTHLHSPIRAIDRCRCHCRLQTALHRIALPCRAHAWPRLDWQLAG